MKLTEKLGLKKPDLTDYVNIGDLNDNMDVLDEAVGELKEGSTVIEELETENKTLSGAINEIKTEVDEHKAESASKHIAESGSNPNGIYIKLDDGTMICYQSFPNLTVNIEPNTETTNDYTFPATFAVTPSVSASGVFTNISGNHAGRVVILHPRAMSSTQLRLYILNTENSLLVEGIRGLSYIAVGRWK